MFNLVKLPICLSAFTLPFAVEVKTEIKLESELVTKISCAAEGLGVLLLPLPPPLQDANRIETPKINIEIVEDFVFFIIIYLRL
jgi:hypothetical protein